MRPTTLFAAPIFAMALGCYGQSGQPDAKTSDPNLQARMESSTTGIDRTAAPAADKSETYVIGPSDALTVTVWKEPTMSGAFLVRPDGKISMALLGDVQAAGLTPLELGDQIKGKLKKYIQDPNVTVRIDQVHSKLVYLLGEVGRKGPLEMTPGMTLLQAISSAGGVTDYANKKKMYILRIEGGKQSKIPVRYKEALKGDEALNLVLKPGDTIVVP